MAKDGQTTMTGAHKLFAGTVSLPGLIFGSDTSTGWYRIGANNWGLSISGTKLLDCSAAVFGITGALTISNGLTLSAGALSLPAGAIETADIADLGVTTAKIAAANVTYAKIQNVSAENKLLGRSTAGAGAVEEVGLDATLAISGGNLGVVEPNGSVYISTTTVSGAASLPVTAGISASYDEYELHVAELRPATDNVNFLFQVSTDGGSTYKTTGYVSSCHGHTGGTDASTTSTGGVLLNLSSGGNTVDNSTDNAWRGLIRFWPNGAANRKNVMFQGLYLGNAAANFIPVTGGGLWDGGNDAVDAFRIIASSGNITGTVRLVGIRNS